MSTDLERELRDAKQLAALLTDRLERLQQANEAVYMEAFDANGGPHLCPGLPFGQLPEQVTT